MRFNSSKNVDPEKMPNKEIILRKYIGEGIKLLYLNRKHLFYEDTRDYKELSGALSLLQEKIMELSTSNSRLMVPGNGQFNYVLMDRDTATQICEYFGFIVLLPPQNFRLRSREKKYRNIADIKVPTLDFVLSSLLNFKIPNYWREKIDLYESASLAIFQLMSESTTNNKISEITGKVIMPDKNSQEWRNIDKMKERIAQWMKLGLFC